MIATSFFSKFQRKKLFRCKERLLAYMTNGSNIDVGLAPIKVGCKAATKIQLE